MEAQSSEEINPMSQYEVGRRPISVLVVSAWDGASGVLTVLRSLARRLGSKGVRYSAFCFNGWHKETKWSACCEKLYDGRRTSLTEVLVREHFDLVHLVDTACARSYNPDVWLARAAYRGAVVCMSQNTIQEIPPGQFADAFVACSAASREVMKRTVNAPIKIIRNGTDLSEFHPREGKKGERPILAWVGRTADLTQKDFVGFLGLVGRLMESKYDFWVADPGQLPEGINLEDWFGNRVRYFRGLNRAAIAEFFGDVARSGGAVVSTSRFEGLPLALIEAIATGCPVIAPRVPGHEWINEDAIGLMYDRSAGIGAIVELLDRLNDQTFRNDLVRRGLSVVQERYDDHHMAEEYYETYLAAIDAAARRSKSSRWNDLLAHAWSMALMLKRRLRDVVPRKAHARMI